MGNDVTIEFVEALAQIATKHHLARLRVGTVDITTGIVPVPQRAKPAEELVAEVENDLYYSGQ